LRKIVLTKKTSAIFLVTVLVAGIIASISSSFMTVESAQAQPYSGRDNRYNSYEPYSGMNNNDRKSYGKDRDRDDNRTGTQGPQGPQGPAGPSTINTTNVYTNVGNTTVGTINTFITSIAVCDAGDTALSGSFDILGSAEIRTFEPLANETGWNATALVTGNAGGGGPNGSVTADVVCFDNPPPHIS
jgi:hypothetical protein